jgi:hypothetical protein
MKVPSVDATTNMNDMGEAISQANDASGINPSR